ncbi:MAG: endonuclease III [Tepidiphilus sp.]|nr:endonuclease III [Tepidiphilus sp.]MDD3434021.1 endonuclease III [Tepidiphilus sp.]
MARAPEKAADGTQARHRQRKRLGAGEAAAADPAAPMTPQEIEAFFERLAALDPHPTTELEYATPFQLLAAVVLSAQATDKSVNEATRTLFAVAPDARAMVALGEEGIAQHIRRIGLYRSKAKHLHELSRRLLETTGGEIPDDRDFLESLPGVGRKTANVVLNTLFGHPVIAVDTHIFRVANRTGLAPGKTVRAVEESLTARVPPRFRRHAHHWLILLGRYTCTARAPRCDACPVHDLCHWPHKPPGTRETNDVHAQP